MRVQTPTRAREAEGKDVTQLRRRQRLISGPGTGWG